MRVAAADIGSNSTRLLVAEIGSDGSIEEVERGLEITRLGEGVDAGGTLGEAPMNRVTDALARYAERSRAHAAGSMLAVATSAVRDAANRDDFLARVAATGFEPRLLSGDDEAATTFAGVCSRAPGEAPISGDGTLVIDVGGGSTELVLGAAGGVAWSRSLQAGCVRMTERLLGEDTLTDAQLTACEVAVAELLEGVPAEVVESTRRAVAVAGTATTVVAIRRGSYDPDAVHGARISREEIRALEQRLAAMPLTVRRTVPGLEPERAPVIIAGLVVLGAALDHFGLSEATVSERDIMHGAVLLAADRALRH
jgi:exopolyphosphatase / guanosine-5'-triphosphate,3'-diphosphate pyrophosphatase